MTRAAGPPAGNVNVNVNVRRFNDDVATAVSAIADIEEILEDEGPLGTWRTTEFRRQCKAMKTRLNTMADWYGDRA